MKTIRLIIILAFVSGLLLSNLAESQVVTNTEALLKYSKEKAVESIERRAQAEVYAKQNDLLVTFENDKGVLFELQYINEDGIPMYYKTDNRNSAKTISTDKVYPGGGAGLNLDGTGITPREWDGGGVRLTHQEYGGRVTQVDNPSSTHWHSTHVAGTIMAAGVQAAAKGMAYNANLRAFDWNSDDSEMASEAAQGALISNHSYGFARGWTWEGGWVWYGNPSISTQEDYKFGFYDNESKAWDQIAANAPYYLIVKSAGNDRNEGPTNGQYPKDGPYDCIAHGGISKNVLTVGAVHDITGGYSGPSSVSMSSFSSWGPADDGRVKPDIVANGVGLYSSSDASNSAYVSSDGTSMSAPSATGSLALLQQHWEDLNGAGNYMTAASLKGLVIHTADEAGVYDGPDYQFGWGLMNTKNAALRISEDQNINVIDEAILTQGGSFEMLITSDGSEDIKVTICWTDLPGQPVGPQLDPLDTMLINDLDLKVTFNGNTYYPWKLNRNSPTAAATNNSENNVDNVEVVFIENPTAGEYHVEVDHDGTLSGGNQAFSIIVSGVTNTVSLPSASAGEDIDLCENSSAQLNGGSTNSSSVLWSTNGDGAFDDPTILDAIYTPGSNDLINGTFELKLTAYALPPLNDSISDSMIVTIVYNPIANAGEDITVCESGSAQLEGNAENYESVIWSSRGDGTFDDPTMLNAIYTLGPVDIEDGQVKLSLLARATDPCQDDDLDDMYVNIIQGPIPNAGPDGETCGANSYQLAGLAENYSGVLWSTLGDGTFDDISLLNAIYTPGSNDITAGMITLNLTAIAMPPCPADSTDYMELTILELPNINAGDDATTCENSSFQLIGVVDNPISVLWSTSGDGNFDNDTLLSTSYLPGTGDAVEGNVTLTLTAYFDGGCEMGYDELQLNVFHNAIADAGSNDSVCKNASKTLAGAADYQSSTEWSTSGDGTFTDANLLNTDYTPGTVDISNGEVILQLNAYPVSPCSEIATSNMTLYVLGCDDIGEYSFNKVGFIIIPNPANNQFVISAKDVMERNVTVKIIGIDGKIVFQKDFDVIGQIFNTTISSTTFASGVYTVLVSTGSKTGTNRLIIQH
ncbi:MAG: S8 family serine peptidase [Bacteroidetes bacterium]|nr:S8 family serine peptidase [Bacteroidota bacterium]MBL6944272.1 S8 family serine peptidase [Bacteroidales bacterium]